MKCVLRGDFIRERREALGYSLQDIADQLGIDRSTVSRWETGITKNLRLDYAGKIAELLRVDPRDFIDFVDENSPSIPGLSERKKAFIASVYDMTDEQVELLQRLVDQIKGRK